MNALTRAARTVIDRPVEEVLGEIIISHKLSMSRLEKMLKSLPAGRTKLQVIVAMERLANEHYELLMDMGALSRAAQLSTVVNYEFKASVGLMPASGRTVNQFNPDPPMIRGELTDGT